MTEEFGPNYHRVDLNDLEANQASRPVSDQPIETTELLGVAFDDIVLSTKSEWLVKGILPRVGVGAIYGEFGTGKSFFALDMVHPVATEAAWRGEYKVQQGMVLYLAAEGLRGIAKRMLAIQQEFPGHAPITLLGDQPDLRTKGGGSLIIGQVKAWHRERFNEHTPRLVVIDTYSQVVPGDQNGTTDALTAIAQLQRIAEELEIFVLIVHHAGKEPGRGMRGSSALSAAMDTIFFVEEKENPHKVTIEKQKDGEGGQEFGFELRQVVLGTDEDGDEITSCVIEHCKAPEKKATARKLGPLQQIGLNTLVEALADFGQSPPGGAGLPHGVTCIEIETWKDQFLLRRKEDDDKNASVSWKRVRDGLLGNSVIQTRGDWVWLPS